MIDERRYGFVVCGYLAACLVLGGASAAGVLANLVLQLAALPLGLFALWRLRDAGFGQDHRFALLILIGVLLLPLAQLVPLDPDIWSNLPGRETVVDGFAALGMDLPWLPLSLDPHDTLASWLALLPPAALAVACLSLEEGRRPWIGWTILALALGSALLAIAQSATNALYLYEITNRGSGVGFFSNRNHLATLLLIAIPIVTLQLPGLVRRRVEAEGGARGHQLFTLGLLGLLLVGLLAVGSRAGLALALPVAVITIGLRIRARRGESPVPLVVGALVLSVAMVAIIALGPRMSRLAAKTGTMLEDETRLVAAPLTAEAGWNAFPAGTGFGSFDAVFRLVGGNANLGSSFVNQAHNDYLDLWLTGGLPAMLLLIAFGWWFAKAARLNWSARSRNPGSVPRVAAVGIAIILVHSIVDYPLRTAAISSIFAVFCILLLAPVRDRGAGAVGYADRRPAPMTRVRATASLDAPS